MANVSIDRRSFLLDALKLSGQVTLATSAVYSIGVFFKDTLPSANMVAGAKTCGWLSTFGGVESACTTGRCNDFPPDPCSEGNDWSGCTSCGSTNGIYETMTCYCN